MDIGLIFKVSKAELCHRYEVVTGERVGLRMPPRPFASVSENIMIMRPYLITCVTFIQSLLCTIYALSYWALFYMYYLIILHNTTI